MSVRESKNYSVLKQKLRYREERGASPRASLSGSAARLRGATNALSMKSAGITIVSQVKTADKEICVTYHSFH